MAVSSPIPPLPQPHPLLHNPAPQLSEYVIQRTLTLQRTLAVATDVVILSTDPFARDQFRFHATDCGAEFLILCRLLVDLGSRMEGGGGNDVELLSKTLQVEHKLFYFDFKENPRDVRKHLKKLNKPALKSIKSPDGDVIDCVPIEKQLALDHPLLLDHKIQKWPNYHPERRFEDIKLTSGSEDNSSGSIKQLWHKNGRCPQGTVPVRRTTKADVMRANKVEHFGKKQKGYKAAVARSRPQSADPGFIQTGHEHAIAYVEDGQFYGAKATMNVWKPQVQDSNEFSLSQIWVLGGTFDLALNSIEAGWQVSPDIYGDNNTRLFTYWTGDTYQATGCYNLLCSGFVQLNSDIALGASIYPISNYGTSQYDISILIWKDQSEGHWWMQFGADHVIGYWPSTLFSLLTDSASMIEWGGEVVNSAADGQHTTTQMGSGHFPNEGFGKASYFRNIQVVDESNVLRDPKDVGTYTEKPNCYSVKTGNNGKWGSYFYYGGPGRNSDCP